MNDLLMKVTGANGQIELYPNKIKITRHGMMAKLVQGFTKGDKEIMISGITGMQVKQPGITVGYIQFVLMGSQESKQGVRSAVSDENTVTFNKKDAENMMALKAKIEELMKAADHGNNKQISAMDELKKLAELKDAGIVTNEEFETKKKQLLGL